MRNIDRFILHVVHNLSALNEYSTGAMDAIMKHYKEEADDLNIQITDDQLKTYIERFDRIKSGIIAKGGTDLIKQGAGGKFEVIVPLSKLIKIVTASPGAELPSDEEEDTTPDVVYQDNGITIWNGAKQGNCITYGASQKLPGGSRWCITEPGGSYFGRYRFGSEYEFPTFYLAKNDNLSDNDKLSFVALQVLNNGEYKFTNRDNNPGMEGPFSWEELNKRVPWLRNIPNLKNILKYIPFSKKEKESEVFKNNPISIKQWIKEPFNTKKQYLIIRAGNRELFSDISNDTFISKYLPKYPDIASVIARTAGIVDINKLIQHLDKFSSSDQTSIVKQIRDKFKLDILDQDVIFDLKKYLVKTNKIDLKSDQRLYVTKDNQAIVLLTLGDNIKAGLYTEEDEYPNIKLNKRTSKYLLDYPELDKIPLRNLVKLAGDDVIDKSVVSKVIDDAKDNPNSALVVKSVKDGEIILDSNSFSSYKVDKNGGIVPISFENEEVQQAFADAKDNEGFQQNALNIFKTDENISSTIDKNVLLSVINATPYNQRVIQLGDTPAILLTTTGRVPFFLMSSTINPRQQRTIIDYGRGRDWRAREYNNNLDAEQWAAYFAYLRNTNQVYNTEGLKTLLGNQGYSMEGNSKKAFIANNPPVAADSQLKPAMNGNTALLINTANPRESFKISDTGKLVKANVSSALARQLLGQAAGAAPQEPAAQAGRRGRPAGVPNAPRAAAQPAAGGGDINVADRMGETGLGTAFMRLPRADLRRLMVTDATRVNPNGDRGAARRNNILGFRGRVGQVIQVGQSKIYIIRLANQQIIASINVQPGNRNYLLTGNDNGNVAIPLNSPSDLLQALQQRNLAETHHYITNEYFDRNPNHLTEFRQLLRQHVNEKKNEN